jgi:hypothetical protein
LRPRIPILIVCALFGRWVFWESDNRESAPHQRYLIGTNAAATGPRLTNREKG